MRLQDIRDNGRLQLVDAGRLSLDDNVESYVLRVRP
jgi:hypothetical protein